MFAKYLQVKIVIAIGIVASFIMIGCQKATPEENSLCQSPNYGKQIEVDEETKPDNQRSTEKHNETSESSVNRYASDYGYKIFYGKWVVEKEIGESYRLEIQDTSDMLMKTFVFSRKKCMFYYDNEEVQIDYPNYDITIIPLDEKTMYFPYMPTMKEIGITSNYVTIFSAMGDYDIYYILKDDNTLVMFYKNVYLELKRIEHEEGYKSNYHAL